MAAPQLPCTSENEYRDLLHHVSDGLKQPTVYADELVKSLPWECAFSMGEKRFNISLAPVRTELETIKDEKDKDDLKDDIEDAKADVDRRLSGLDAYGKGTDSTVPSKLHSILERREFRHVGQQDASTILKEQMILLLVKLFSMIASNREQAALFAQITAWTLCILIGGFLLWKVYRWVTQEGPQERAREYVAFTPSAKHWRKWLEEARTALANGDLRGAVHFSYWAAISDLESSGAWRPDRARTPREYLRLMSELDPARPLLKDLTRDFEIIWYGNRIPQLDECNSFMAKVEQIACH